MSTTRIVCLVGILAAAVATHTWCGDALVPPTTPPGRALTGEATATPGATARPVSRQGGPEPVEVSIQRDSGAGVSLDGVAANCPAEPPGAVAFEIRFVIDNSPNPIPRSDPAFPGDSCAPDSVMYGTADGRGAGTPFGTFTMHDRYCIRPPDVIGAADFTTQNGDTFYAEYVATPTVFPPPFPNVEFTGSGTVTGGTGKLADATGAFGIAGKQLGVLIPGTNIAAQSAFIFCGYVNGK